MKFVSSFMPPLTVSTSTLRIYPPFLTISGQNQESQGLKRDEVTQRRLPSRESWSIQGPPSIFFPFTTGTSFKRSSLSLPFSSIIVTEPPFIREPPKYIVEASLG
ncbi:hypothetical protein TTHERM_000441911 (macronuclear) [Tetrahymena thermophila SB210]|uniref:Uncharacterized protein n=1 Tax=Tetrahymena thermophila (strain SB210) TaxID=312017 RepID=W7XHR6_TETTS|nr:hypothetical protein TTHERM_000441911 [Tetrahymena thermophila SB210]EWS73991.1 hypothetical protein TTHERM_000441911 [Tetrahymena thermophila SB210]|eukprot:XP_012653453.1 hypothetical protein TTHERM_000441911 [Tetrahymena thermophila SB210]